MGFVWSDVFGMQLSVLEKVLRTVAVYAGLAILLRVAGKRDMAQLNTFDLVVVLLLSNVVQNAVIGPDNSLTGGLLGAVVLVAVNAGVVRLANLYPRLTGVFEGRATELVRDGEVVANLRRLGLRHSDVAAVLRRQGADDLSQVHEATLAPGGTIVVDLKEESKNATRRDLDRERDALVSELRAEIESLSARLGERLDTGLAAIAAEVRAAQGPPRAGSA